MSVIPHKTESTVTCSTAAFAKLVKAIAPFANEKYKGVTLTIEGGLLTLSTKNPEGDKVTVDMPCTRSGEVTDYEIGFNLTYLLDVLSVINAKEVDLNFNDPNSSCLITPHDMESTQYVIMPMRL
jgi:DNA polymerase-3 subunit beta